MIGALSYFTAEDRLFRLLLGGGRMVAVAVTVMDAVR